MAVNKEKNTQVLVTFPKNLLEMIEEYWHCNNMKNRNEAIRDIVKEGLKATSK